MDHHSNETLADDIRNLADRLLCDPIAAKIFEHTPPMTLFSESGNVKIRDIAESADFLRRYQMPRYRSVGFRQNADVAIGLARRITEGEFNSTEDAAALRFINENMLLTYENPTGNATIGISAIKGRCIDFEDFFRFFVPYMKNAEVPGLLRKWQRAHEEQDSAIEQFYEAGEAGCQLISQYGWIRDPRFQHVGLMVIDQSIDYSDAVSVRAVANQCLKFCNGTAENQA